MSLFMGHAEDSLTELQFTILNGMADDYEDVEQLYLYANRELEAATLASIQFPLILLQVRFPLRIVIEEIVNMLREGYIVAKYSNDEQMAPLQPLNLSALHHYWFGASDSGAQFWKAYSAAKD
jgi:hypothetical protein